MVVEENGKNDLHSKGIVANKIQKYTFDEIHFIFDPSSSTTLMKILVWYRRCVDQ